MESLYGLISKQTAKPVPLKHIDVSVHLCDTVGQVRSKLIYMNESDVAVEALFSFPTDDSSAFFQCDAEIDGRYIIGECQPKDEAKATYTTAVESGYGAFLMQEHDHTGDIFRMSLGNLGPGKSATILFSYVLELAIDQEGAVEFTLPTVLNPRYNPRPEEGGYTGPDPVTYCQASEVPYTFEFHGTIESQMEVQDVVSFTQQIQWTRDGNGEIAVNLKDKYDFKSDLNVRVLYCKAHKPSLMVAKGNPDQDGILKHDVAMLSFFPKLESAAESGKTEFIFVVDRSGSMQGSRIEQTKATLLLFLKSLPVGCYFNIISFGSNFDMLFKESTLYDKMSLEKAMKLQETMQANMGGTEILQPLKHMYEKMSTIPGHPRQVFVLTDGGVSNTQAVIQLVQKHTNDTRVFSFGIGKGASTSLVKGIARAGKGKAEFVTDAERLQPKVVSLLSLAAQPKVTDVAVQWGSSTKFTTIPDELPPVFSGEHLLIYGVADSKLEKGQKLSVTLSGRVDNQTIEEKLEYLVDDLGDSNLLLHRLAIKRQIKLLEDRQSKRSKDQIVALSLAANTISQYTAFVGVDTATKEKFCEVKSIAAPCDYPVLMCNSALSTSVLCCRMSSHNVTFGSPNKGVCRKQKKLAAGAPMKEENSVYSEVYAQKKKGGSFSVDIKNRLSAAFSSVTGMFSSPKDSKQGEPVQEALDDSCHRPTAQNTARHGEGTCQKGTMEKVISLQEYDGCWKLDQNLAALLLVELTILKKNCPVHNENVWATALVLAWLKTRCAEQKDEWKMIASKAKAWLKSNHRDTECNLVDLAKRYV